MKRLGKYTFTDALDYKFNSKAIQLMAAISTLVVSMFYLIPQMVGAGALVTPLLGLPHWVGVIMVGTIVIFIVATAGMTSTTYVQFLKGGLLIIFSTILTILLLNKGIDKKPSEDYHNFQTINVTLENSKIVSLDNPDYTIIGQNDETGKQFVKLSKDGVETWWQLKNNVLEEALSKTTKSNGEVLYNGQPKEDGAFYQVGHMNKIVYKGEEVEGTGKLNPFSFLSTIDNSEVVRFPKSVLHDGKDKVTVWYQQTTLGKELMRPGLKFKVEKGSAMQKINFISLMLALFFGTAALPHILIRYYTVPSQKDARKSTIVAIGAIGFFYILTMYLGIGAMVSGVIDVESSNMSAPLLAKFFGISIFSIISAIAFATVLGTVSGLIVASSGAIAHDLINRYFDVNLTDKGKVKAGKISAIGVGLFAILLGILFKGMNVSFLVGWAFAVAASANLPAILMLLFWKKTTAKGIASSILVGMISAITIILLSPSMFVRFGLDPATAPIGLDNPGIISIPLSFLTLIIVSLMTQENKEA